MIPGTTPESRYLAQLLLLRLDEAALLRAYVTEELLEGRNPSQFEDIYRTADEIERGINPGEDPYHRVYGPRSRLITMGIINGDEDPRALAYLLTEHLEGRNPSMGMSLPEGLSYPPRMLRDQPWVRRSDTGCR